jgi:hypothetical protein
MKILLTFFVWCVLFVLCWPVALLAIILFPLVWLIALPFRIAGLVFAGLFAFLRGIFMLPAKLVGGA